MRAQAHPRHWPIRLLLSLFCLALWLPGFFTLPATDRDESRFAQATKQMNETGDYLRIMNGRVSRLRKPIGVYWLQAPFAAVAGTGLANPIWPYRMPSLMGGIAAALATFEAGLVLMSSRQAAGMAAAMLAASMILTAEIHIATTDAALLGATTFAMMVLARAWMGARIPAWLAGLFWLSVAAGVLLKGPITPMVTGLATAALCLWERRAAWLAALRPAWGVPLLLAVALPWFVAINMATNGAFFDQAVGGDLAGKLAGGAETHGAPPGLHLLLMPLLAFPSTVFVFAGLFMAWTQRRDPATRFLIAWALPAWLVFEAAPTKLPHYTLPLYPALFLLAAAAIGTAAPYLASSASKVGRVVAILAGFVLAVAAAALPPLLHAPWWLGIPSSAAICIATTLAIKRGPGWALAAAVPLYVCLLHIELPNLSQLWLAPRVMAELRRDWPGMNAAGVGLALAGYAEPSLVFLTGTRTQLWPSGESVAIELRKGTIKLVVVTDREMASFERATHALGMTPKLVGHVDGYNSSRGRWVTLNLLIK